jgi:hypothetical protein
MTRRKARTGNKSSRSSIGQRLRRAWHWLRDGCLWLVRTIWRGLRSAWFWLRDRVLWLARTIWRGLRGAARWLRDGVLWLVRTIWYGPRDGRGPRLRYAPGIGSGGRALADGANTLAVVIGLGMSLAAGAGLGLRVGGVVLGLAALGAAYWLWQQANDSPGPRPWPALPPATALVGLATFAANGTALVMAALKAEAAEVVAGFVAWPAYLAWMAAEAVHSYETVTQRPKSGASIARLVKSVCQMLGLLFAWLSGLLAFLGREGPLGGLATVGQLLIALGTALSLIAAWRNARQR